jgi:hypothetical protein
MQSDNFVAQCALMTQHKAELSGLLRLALDHGQTALRMYSSFFSALLYSFVFPKMRPFYACIICAYSNIPIAAWRWKSRALKHRMPFIEFWSML